MANMTVFTAGGVQYAVKDAGSVHHSEAQQLSDAAKARARDNIAAADAAKLAALSDYVINMSPLETVGPAAIASTDKAAPLDAEDVTASIEPVQAGSGTPSPENVRPITGWKGAKVTKCGKNLFDASKIPSSARQTCTLIDDGFMLTANSAGTYFSTNMKIYGSFSGKAVYLKGNIVNSGSNTGYISVRFYNDADEEITNSIRCEISAGRGSNTKTAPEGTTRLVIVCYSTYNTASAVGDSATFTNVILSMEDAAYEPYRGETYNIAFPAEAGTVYGGTLDVTTGLLTVDRFLSVFDGSEDWMAQGANSSGAVYHAACPAKKGNVHNMAQYICSLFGMSNNQSAASPTGSISGVSNGGAAARMYFFIRYDLCSDIDAWKEFLANNPLQISALLATPQTYQLTPQDIALLRGSNTIWADTGDTTLAYRQDVAILLSSIAREAGA